MNNVYTLLQGRSPKGRGGGRASAALPLLDDEHRIACVAAPCICPPGARAKVQTLFIDGP